MSVKKAIAIALLASSASIGMANGDTRDVQTLSSAVGIMKQSFTMHMAGVKKIWELNVPVAQNFVHERNLNGKDGSTNDKGSDGGDHGDGGDQKSDSGLPSCTSDQSCTQRQTKNG